MAKYTIELEIDDDTLTDIVGTCFDYHYSWWTGYWKIDPDRRTIAIEEWLNPDEEGRPNYKPEETIHTVTFAQVATRIVERALEQYIDNVPDLNEADAVVQLAALGEIVYA